MSKLSEIMREQGVTVKELADATGVSESAIWRLRNGQRGGDVYTWKSIAEYLGVTLDELLR